MAQYVVRWENRSGGSGADAEADAKRGLQLFGKWSPPADANFKVFVARLDGRGGYAVVETDNPASLAEGPAKFGTLFDFTIEPVIDINESIPIGVEAIEFRDSIS